MFALNPSFGQGTKTCTRKKSGLASINVKLNEMGIELDDEKKALLNDVKNAGLKRKVGLRRRIPELLRI